MSMFRVCPLTDEDVARAKAHRNALNITRGTEGEVFTLGDGNDYTGWLAEIAFARCFPRARQVNGFDYDYISPGGRLRIEIKNNNGKGEWALNDSRWICRINQEQFEKKRPNVFVASYYVLGSKRITFVGWQEWRNIPKLGNLIQNEEGNKKVFKPYYAIPMKNLKNYMDVFEWYVNNN